MRQRTRKIFIGKVAVGGASPVSIQSMTKTPTSDIKKTVKQIKSLEAEGCEIVRVAIKDTESAEAISKIIKKIRIPLEADIHFDYRLALLAIANGANAVRLNPGNIRRPDEIKEVVRAAKKKGIPIRIGVNSGSAGPRTRDAGRTMIKLILDYIKIFEKEKFYDIMISLKTSSVCETIKAYREISKKCNYPLHLGVTATGAGKEAIVKSAIGIGALLAEGIGDTIRVSLTGAPEEEVQVAKDILQALGLRRFYPDIISCPTCGRCQVDLIKIVNDFKNKLYAIRYPLYAKIAIMGCEVNGPGEARDADIGIAFGKGAGILFKKGKIIKKVKAANAVKELIKAMRGD